MTPSFQTKSPMTPGPVNPKSMLALTAVSPIVTCAGFGLLSVAYRQADAVEVGR